jgi:hypothetical protein
MIVIAGLFIGLLCSAILRGNFRGSALRIDIQEPFHFCYRGKPSGESAARPFLGTKAVQFSFDKVCMLGPMSIERESNFVYALAFLGALIGGALLM